MSGLRGGGVGYSWWPRGGTGQLRAGTYFGVVRVGVPGVLRQGRLLLPSSEFSCRAKKEEAVGGEQRGEQCPIWVLESHNEG